MDCKQLVDVADGQTRLIKIDTDGFDVPILSASLDFLAQRRPCLYYENIVRDEETLFAADRLVTDLVGIAYRFFAVFDDAGLHLISTTDPEMLKSLNRYLYKMLTGPERGYLHNYDVLCLPAEDADVFAAVNDYYRQY